MYLTHLFNVALVGLFDWFFMSFLVNEIDEILIPVQRDLFFEVAARCIHLDD
jgi:hypothetical protein